MPSPDHVWTIAEYKTATDVLCQLAQKGKGLPRWHSQKSDAVFERLIDRNNLNSTAQSLSTNLAEKFGPLNNYIQSSQKLILKYIATKPFPDHELVELLGQVLHVSTIMVKDMPAIYQKARITEGGDKNIKLLHQGLAEQVKGTLMTLEDHNHLGAESRVRFCQIIRETFPLLLPDAPAELLDDANMRLRKMFEGEQDQVVKSALEKTFNAVAAIKLRDPATLVPPAKHAVPMAASAWQLTQSSDSRFSAKFPGNVERRELEDQNSLDNGKVHIEMLQCVATDDIKYVVVQIGPLRHPERVKSDIPEGLKSRNDVDARTLEMCGAIGRQVSTGHPTTSIMRLVTIGKYGYVIGVESIDQMTAINMPDAILFLNSFNVDTAKPPQPAPN